MWGPRSAGVGCSRGHPCWSLGQCQPQRQVFRSGVPTGAKAWGGGEVWGTLTPQSPLPVGAPESPSGGMCPTVPGVPRSPQHPQAQASALRCSEDTVPKRTDAQTPLPAQRLCTGRSSGLFPPDSRGAPPAAQAAHSSTTDSAQEPHLLISPQLPPERCRFHLPVSQATDLGVISEGEALRHRHVVSGGILLAHPSGQADAAQLGTAGHSWSQQTSRVCPGRLVQNNLHPENFMYGISFV